MNCEQAIHLISARIDHEIQLDDRALLEMHLQDCEACRATADAFDLQHGELIDTFEPRRQAAALVAERVNAQLPDSANSTQHATPASQPGLALSFFRAAGVLTAVAAVLVPVIVTKTLLPPARMALDSSVSVSSRDRSADFGMLLPRQLPEPLPPQLLAVGSEIHTKAGERRRVTLPDASVLYINQDTTLRLDEDRKVHLETGEVYVEVSPRAPDQNGATFTVQTADRTFTALGTKFAVNAERKGSELLVAQGKVKVESPGFLETVLHGFALRNSTRQAGEAVPSDAQASPAERVTHVLDWTRDLMASANAVLVPASQYDGGALIAVDSNGQEAKLSLRRYGVDVHIEDGFARTTIDQTYFNNFPWRLEGTFYFPLPPDASLSRLAMYVDGHLMEGGMAERQYARQVYDRIVSSQRDPALLEWVDGTTFKMRVFPLEGRQEKRIILSYTQRLPTLYGRTQYRFPAGHSLQVGNEWSFHARVKNGAKLFAESPTNPSMKITPAGADLVLTDEARAARIDRDVVLDLTDTAEEKLTAARFSRADHDGKAYLMLRCRPELQTEAKPQRRDWIFLYESSADRDPLLARVQIETIRTILSNAEHDDTFCILTAGTIIRSFSKDPVPATPKNVKAAMEFLDRTHLVGALDLGHAFATADEIAKASKDPYLVHVGSGITHMGVVQNDLLDHLPKGVRYVGVGVGKHYDRNFMKQAAERTGGYYTQINPDESVAWRAFDLLATLNTPRLLNVQVAEKGPANDESLRSHFLVDSPSICQGEEICAMTQLPIPNPGAAPRLPAALVVTGLLDGQPYRQEIPVAAVAGGANYLPRTWAKLEIDRMLAQNSAANEQKIVELSKAMYVMTPYTSLLVLENEDMYKEFKVDRGRKDHWALYPCPETIKVVYELDPTQPVDVRNAPKGDKPAANQVLQTLLVRVPPNWLELENTNRRSANSAPVMTAVQVYSGAYALPEDPAGIDLGDEAERQWGRRDLGEARDALALRFADIDEEAFFGEPKLRARGDLQKSDNKMKKRMFVPEQLPALAGRQKARQDFALGAFRDREMFMESATPQDFGLLNSDVRTGLVKSLSYTAPMKKKASLGNEKLFLDEFEGVQAVSPTALGRRLAEWKEGGGAVNYFYAVSQPHALDDSFMILLPKVNEERLSELEKIGDTPDIAFERSYKRAGKRKEVLARRSLDRTTATNGRMYGFDALARGSSLPVESQSLLYQRNVYSNDARLFTDLLTYAPGLNTSVADIQATLEAEAAPELRNSPGHVDPAARRLIDRARTPLWHQFQSRASAASLRFDNSGRFIAERTLPLGLHETTICDGTTQLKLYPEIGLASTRPLSRFHRAELLDAIPWLTPPADDLAHGADVELVNETTVAVIPHGARDLKSEGGKKPQYLRMHLVFERDRLAERQLVIAPENKVVLREIYDGLGAIRLMDEAGNQLQKTSLQLADVAEPNLHPDTKRLVVLPLPLRSRQHVLASLDLDPAHTLQEVTNACYRYLSPEAALQLLASLYAEGNAYEAFLVVRDCFLARGDSRPGLFALLLASGFEPGANAECFAAMKTQVDQPIVRYMLLHGNEPYHALQRRWPLNWATTVGAPDSFLRRLAEFDDLTWRDPVYLSPSFRTRAILEDQKRYTDFIARNSKNVLGWALLNHVQDRRIPFYSGTVPEAWLWAAQQWDLIAHALGNDSNARYECAVYLRAANHRDEACALFQKLYSEDLNAGVLPPIDYRFRSALESDATHPDLWNPLILKTAKELLTDDNRSAVIALASQCQQLGDAPLAENLLRQALAGLDATDDLRQYLGTLEAFRTLKDAEKETVVSRAGMDRVGRVTLQAIAYYRRLSNTARAEELVDSLLARKEFTRSPGLWRLASTIANDRGSAEKSIQCLERALDLEFANLPPVINLETWRSDYGRLLNHYQAVVNSAVEQHQSPPGDIANRTIRAVDRWRKHDPEASGACRTASEILFLLGAREIAWEYLTTAEAREPTNSHTWDDLGQRMQRRGQFGTADMAFATAVEADPSDATILWNRSQNLRQAGDVAGANKLLRQIADSEWPPVYNNVRANARWQLQQP